MKPLQMTTPTDPTGKSFLSYRRSRATEVALLITAQHLHGIPTWQDIGDLENGPTEPQIRQTLADPTIANAMLWITPGGGGSMFIPKVEVPLILSRVERDDGFFAVPVAAGGLDFHQAADVLGPHASFHHLAGWNLVKADSDPITYTFAAELALRVLRHRLNRIHRRLPAGEPLKLRLSTRDPEPYSPGTALVLNWHAQFTNREAPADTWTLRLLPALQDIGKAICQEAPNRSFEASGKPSLVAAVALGVLFLAPRNIPVAWRQVIPGQDEQLWSLRSGRTRSRLRVNTTLGDVGSSDLAVLVAIARRQNEVHNDFTSSQGSLPAFRAILEVGSDDGARYDLANASEALDVAHTVIDAITDAKAKLGGVSVIHLFLAVPAGLAMLIGQLLNGLPKVHLYEHVPGASPGPYRPALSLDPANL